MILSQVLRGIEHISDIPDKEVTGICCDSRKFEKGNIFVCIKGLTNDSHDLVTKEMAEDASAVIVSRDLKLKNQVLVSDTRKALALAAANFYGNRKNDLKLIAVTGTNGKTTVSTLIKQVLESVGKKAGLIGTVKYEMNDYSLPARYTTPDPLELHQLFDKMYRMGIEYVVMEASSQALSQMRLYGVEFDVALFTNLTRDHLDYHGTMENYYLAKKELFSAAKKAIVNIDDEYGERLFSEIKEECAVSTCSAFKNEADYVAKNIRSDRTGVSFEVLTIGAIGRISMNTPGMFSVSNGLMAAAALTEIGVPLNDTINALRESAGVKGRSEIIAVHPDFTVISDYAHTPDSLEKIFSSVKEYAPARVVALFGAAGMRDSKKRAMMGKKAAEFADFVIITSDNPRGENAEKIAHEVEEGVIESGKPYKIIIDRYDAIFYAIEHAEKDDIIVLAGKGHEDYQVLDGVSVYFDEKEIVLMAIDKFYGGK